MATITFEDVTKTHGDGRAAVANLDLDVADGEFLILVGPSGCGKSTVLRMVAGLDAPTSGRLLIGGVVANGLAPRERDVAMVFQSYALYPHLSVADNIGFGLKVRGAAPAAVAGRVREVAAILELTDYLGRRPAQLSGGQRQRVAMARALVRSPSAFLMDEPLSNLDARLRGHMREEIVRLQRRTGVTTLYVTHDQVEAMTMGSRVAVLNRGRLHQVGTPRALYAAPRDRFVARFIGSPEMNMLHAAAEADGAGGVALRVGPRLLPVEPDTPLAAVLRARGPDVVLGLRPEGFRLGREGEAGALSGTVRFVEHLGATALAGFDLEGVRALADGSEGDDGFAADRRPFKALLGEDFAASPGEPLRLVPDLGRLHVFDPDTGLALRA